MRPWTAAAAGPPDRAGRASMGPRPCGRGRRRRAAFGVRTVRLQWGHGLAAVDGPCFGQHLSCHERASMGPRPCGRGRGAPVEVRPAWYLLQWGHGLAAVDGKSNVTPCGQLTCFNGATALRPWTACRQARRAVAVRLASMGPRPCGRGRYIPAPFTAPMEQGFNGATALRPWTGVRTARCLTQAKRLQWGHGLAAVDGVSRLDKCFTNMPASMGPRPCGRGRLTVSSYKQRPGGFNGATALRPWTGSRRVCRRPDRIGFNGATALRPWTAVSQAEAVWRYYRLQWGHGLAAVDGSEAGAEQAGADAASMGPRPCGRGRDGAGLAPGAGAQLQWGHGLAAVDGFGDLESWEGLDELQWGHGLAAVDGSTTKYS